MQKPRIYLTFDLERDRKEEGGFVDPASFQAIRHNLPRVLDRMAQYNVKGTFFVTPEVIEEFPHLITMLTRDGHTLGLHPHVYYQPEFKGWQAGGDSFRNYSETAKASMISRDFARYATGVGLPARVFRIGNLEVDDEILRLAASQGCQYDSSFHVTQYHFFDKVKAARLGLREFPVNFHLYALRLDQLRRGQSVLLIHPLIFPLSNASRVYDEQMLFRIMEACSRTHEFRRIGD